MNTNIAKSEQSEEPQKSHKTRQSKQSSNASKTDVQYDTFKSKLYNNDPLLISKHYEHDPFCHEYTIIGTCRENPRRRNIRIRRLDRVRGR